MSNNSFYRSEKEIVGNVFSPDYDFQPLELSEDTYFGEDSSSCLFNKERYIGKETKEQQYIMIERKRILRRKGSCKSSGTSRSNSASAKSSIFLGDLADGTSDSYTCTDSSYSGSMENLPRSIIDQEMLENDNMSLELLHEGSKLMKSIKLPTVITRVKNYNLQHSMVYYVTLEAESEESVGQIPALMFSSHCCSGKRTDLAELLPLCVTRCEWSEFLSLGPMLRRGRYKKMFGKGCNFKIIALSGIRVVDWAKECPWKLWDLNIKEMHKVVVDIIYKDIRHIPKKFLKALKYSKRNETFIKPKLLSGKKVRLSPMLSTETKLSQSSRKSKLSDYCSDLEFTGLGARGGSSFAAWFKTIPPNVCVDQNFKCTQGTILKRDNFSNVRRLDEYLRISEEV